MEHEDFKWVWAGYRKGAFAEDVLPKGLDRAGFDERFTELLSHVREAWILEARVGEQRMPVGLAVAAIMDGAIYPHVSWFAWGTIRSHLETAGKFLDWLRRQGTVLIFARADSQRFFAHVEQYGVIRRAGTIPDYDNGKPAWIFHGVRKWK